jgi:hypothetical protein
VRLLTSSDNTIVGNYIGLTADGTAALETASMGIQIMEGGGNTVGGAAAGEGNVFGGLDLGLVLHRSTQNTISGNYFGLTADGSASLPITYFGVQLTSGASQNTIGGSATGARNAFAGGAQAGVDCRGSGTDDNRLVGNYFGLNASGTRQRRLGTGVSIILSAGRQTIGGSSRAHGNYFTPKGGPGSWPRGVAFSGGAGGDSVIRHNRFGIRPDGATATRMNEGLLLGSLNAKVTDNNFAGATFWAIRVLGAAANPQVYRNRFRDCAAAVYITDGARCRLGNLGNASPADDGGNYFRDSNTYHIRNFTPNRIRAEGNNFGTTSSAAINAKIWDRTDDPSLGKVDFIPLMGGATATGGAPSLTVAVAAAQPTPGGADIAFVLSTPAQVQARVLNIAGRPVRTLCYAKDCGAGANTLLWDAQDDRGLPVPNGTYLVEVTAETANGGRAAAVGHVSIRR